MALVDSEGFGLSNAWADFMTYNLFTRVSPIAGTLPVIHAAGGDGMYGDPYARVWNDWNAYQRALPSELGTFYFGARTRLNGGTISPAPISGYLFNDANFNTQFAIAFGSDGVITAHRATFSGGFGYQRGTVIGTSAPLAMPTNGWQWVEVYGLIDPTAGAVTVRVNGVAVLTLTGVNTKGSSVSSTVRRIGFQTQESGGTFNFDTQHWYVCDNTGAAPWNTFLGDVRVVNLYPTADDAVQFTPNGDATNHQNVARVPPVPFTDFNSSSTVGQQDTFAMTQVDASTPVILGVHNKPLLYKNDAGAREAASVLKSGVTTDVGPSNVLSNTAAQLLRIYQVDPNTSAQWTLAAVNALKAGYKVSA
jgi:hypothetical protein